MATIKGKSLAWENLGKESDRIRAQYPGRFRKWTGWGQTQLSSGKTGWEVGKTDCLFYKLIKYVED